MNGEYKFIVNGDRRSAWMDESGKTKKTGYGWNDERRPNSRIRRIRRRRGGDRCHRRGRPGEAIIMEPAIAGGSTPGIQLACSDASLAIAPLLNWFGSVSELWVDDGGALRRESGRCLSTELSFWSSSVCDCSIRIQARGRLSSSAMSGYS